MNRKLERGLTHIFGLTRKRDAMLGDLLYTMRMEERSAHLETLLMDLAFCYNRSEDVAKCLCAAVEYIDETSGPGNAHDLAHRMAMEAGEGPVALLLTVRLPELKKRADLALKIRRESNRILDRIRYQTVGDGVRLTPTLLCFNHDDAVCRPVHPELKPTKPGDFLQAVRNYGFDARCG